MVGSTPALRKAFRSVLPILAITALGAGVRLYHISAQSLWLDESLSVSFAHVSLSELLDLLKRVDTHPPLYYAILHFVLSIGDSDRVLRLFSAFAGIATIPVMYGMGTVLGGRRLAMIAALILSLSPWHVSYAQEARMYTLLTLTATISMYGLARLIEEARSRKLGSDHTVSRPSQSSALSWLAYILGTALALWTYNLAIFLLAASNLVVIGLWLMREVVEIRFLRKWVIAQIAVLALWGPWIPLMFIQAASVYHAYWIPAPNISTLIDTFQTYSAAFISRNYADSSSIPINPHEVWLLRPFFNLFVLALIVYTLWVWRQQRHWIFLLLCFWLVAPLGQLFASIWRPIFLDRSLIWTSIPFYFLIACGISQLKPRVMLMFTSVIVLVNLFGIRNYYLDFQKEGWSAAADFVAKHVQSNDLILFNANFAQLPFDHYFRKQQRTIEEHGIPLDASFNSITRAEMRTEDVERIKDLVEGHCRIWLVSSYNGATDPMNLVSKTLDRVGKLTVHEPMYAVDVSMYNSQCDKRS